MNQLWSQDDGLIEVTAAFQGFSQPLHEIVDDIHRRGWTVGKIQVKDGEFVAEGKSPHGEKIEATGRTDATAAANLLVRIMRREFIRSSALKQKIGAWDPQPIEQQLAQVAQAYAGAPVYEPKAAPAWMELAQDCQRRAQTIRQQITVEYTNDPVPYQTADDVREDVTKKRHIVISRAFAHHPVWSESQMLDYRLVVDVLGHLAGGGDWGWHGTCLAFAQLAPLLAEAPQKALFTELVGQSAYGGFYRNWGPQKIAFLDELIEKEQKQENGPGHHGVHPTQAIVPAVLPRIGRVGAMTRAQRHQLAQSIEDYAGSDTSRVVHEFPDGWTIRQPQRWGDMEREGQLMSNCLKLDDPNNEWMMDAPYEDYDAEFPDQVLHSLRDPYNLPHTSFYYHPPRADYEGGFGEVLGQHNTWPKSSYLAYLDEFARQQGIPWTAAKAGFDEPSDWDKAHLDGQDVPTQNPAQLSLIGSVDSRDPNADWESGIQPLPDAAYLWQRADGVDPLNSQALSDALYPLEPGIANMHPEMRQQAVVNALRMSLLGSRTNPRGHAVHYQDLMNIPAKVDDPMAYWDALEQQREQHNQAQGYAPGSHKQHWPEEQQFKQWVKATNPQLDDGEVQQLAKRELLHMLSEEEERILAQDEGEQLPAEVVEHEAYEALRRRLKALTKPNVDQKVDFGDQYLFHEATFHADMYPPYLSSRLRPLALIGRNAQALAEAAREDLHGHGGRGHRFRSAVLSLGIPGVGPRQASMAWLHLAPQTSQLGIVDPHIAEVLDHSYPELSNRDYFKAERELAAGRDASGYNHVPLGAFTTGLWDLKNFGPGVHPDRTAFKAYAPAPHHSIDWNAQTPTYPDWTEPYWWDSTEAARDQVAKDFDRSVATQFGRDEVPFQRTSAERQVMYHSTSLPPEIALREGLQAQTPYNPESGEVRPRGVYVSPEPQDAYGSYIYAIDIEGLAMDYDNELGDEFIAQDVPPDRITRIAGAAFSTQLPLPWVINPLTGERNTGAPGMSLMQHLKDTFGHPSVQEVWNQDYELGKDAPEH